MSEPGIDVVGVGNAIVDVIAEVDDSFIVDHGLVKNSMTLIDGERADLLGAAMPPGIVASGGSAANTMVGVADFGGVAAYLGLVAADDLGGGFRSDLRAAGGGFDVPREGAGLPTARRPLPGTSDAPRTLNTHPRAPPHPPRAPPTETPAVDPPAVRSAQCASSNIQHAPGALAHDQPSRVKSVGRPNVLADLAGAVDDGSGPVGRNTGVPILGVLPVAFPSERLSR